jgi:outer membrane protein assembly factor BamE (lipoprotein component of BamABCDE complex)
MPMVAGRRFSPRRQGCKNQIDAKKVRPTFHVMGTKRNTVPMISKKTTLAHPRGRQAPMLALACALATPLALAGCGSYFGETLQRGYVLPEGALEQIPIGATQEQVLIVLGTPSTVATVDGDAFYYISQKAERSAAFMPHQTVDQRVIAVYFDKDRKVTRLANYGIKDGKVFDYLTQTTETGGERLNYLRGIFRNFKMF